MTCQHRVMPAALHASHAWQPGCSSGGRSAAVMPRSHHNGPVAAVAPWVGPLLARRSGGRGGLELCLVHAATTLRSQSRRSGTHARRSCSQVVAGARGTGGARRRRRMRVSLL